MNFIEKFMNLFNKKKPQESKPDIEIMTERLVDVSSHPTESSKVESKVKEKAVKVKASGITTPVVKKAEKKVKTTPKSDKKPSEKKKK